MSKICKICNEKITFGKSKLSFVNERKEIHLYHPNCYMELSKEEKKQLKYNTKAGAPKFNKKDFAFGVLVLGVVGGFGYTSGAFNGAVWGVNRVLKKNGFTFDYIDNIAIDNHNMHYWLLSDKEQEKILKPIRESKGKKWWM